MSKNSPAERQDFSRGPIKEGEREAIGVSLPRERCYTSNSCSYRHLERSSQHAHGMSGGTRGSKKLAAAPDRLSTCRGTTL